MHMYNHNFYMFILQVDLLAVLKERVDLCTCTIITSMVETELSAHRYAKQVFDFHW